MRRLQDLFCRYLLLFVLLFALTLPFPLTLVTSPGTILHPFFETANSWTADNILFLSPGYNAAIESDSTGFYIHLLHLAMLALAGAFSWQIFRKTGTVRTAFALHIIAAYLLAFFLLKYGFDKIFKVQFYKPEPNILYTPLGMLSKDILFWSAAGSSYGYSFFSGIMEILPAILLFSARTRFAGGLIACGVMIHVLAVNLSFDISVKILSCYLLLLSVIVISPYRGMFRDIFISRKTHTNRPSVEFAPGQRSRTVKFIKALCISMMLFESLYIYVDHGLYNDDHAPRPPFHGAYTVHKDQAANQITFLGETQRVRRLFIHRKGYLIVQYTDDKMKDFKAVAGSADGKIYVFTRNNWKEIDISKISTDIFKFTWKENADTTIAITARKEDLASLPLSRDDIHWNADHY